MLLLAGCRLGIDPPDPDAGTGGGGGAVMGGGGGDVGGGSGGGTGGGGDDAGTGGGGGATGGGGGGGDDAGTGGGGGATGGGGGGGDDAGTGGGGGATGGGGGGGDDAGTGGGSGGGGGATGGGGGGSDAGTGGGSGGGGGADAGTDAGTGGGTGGGGGATNAAPSWGTLPLVVVVSEGATSTVTLTATDPENDPLTFSLVSPPSWVTLSGAVVTLAPGFTEALPNNGTYTVTFQVSDGTNTVPGFFAVLVLNTNAPPQLDPIPLVTMDEGETRTVTLSASDADGTTVTFTALVSSPAFASLSNGVVTLAPDFTQASATPYTVNVTMTDGTTTSTGSFQVQVNNKNQLPAFTNLTDVTVAENATATVTLAGSDPDGEALTFALLAPPAWASLTGAVIDLSPGFSDATGAAGVTLNVQVSDGTAVVDGSFKVVVTNTNRPPTLADIANVTMTAGTTQTVVFNGTDPDLDLLSYDVAPLPTWGALDGGSIILSPARTVVATQELTVTANDGLATAQKAFTVTVNAPPNQEPVVTAPAQVDGAGMAVAPGTSLAQPPRVRASVDDPEDQQVRLEVEVTLTSNTFSNAPTQSGSLGAEGQLELVLNSLPAGDYKWQARAVDAAGKAGAWVPFNNGNPAFTIIQGTVSGTISVAGGAAAVNTATVSLALTASTSTPAGSVTTMAFSNDGTTFSTPEAFATTRAGWALAPGDGTKTVYVRFTDNQGFTTTVSDSVVLDTVAPTVSSFVINSNAASTNSTTSTLSWSATDTGSGVASEAVSNDAVAYTNVSGGSAVWLLSMGDGTKTVSLRVRDGAGNQTIVTDTILLDAAPPVLSVVSVNGGAAWTNATSATVSLTVNDGAGAGLAQVCFNGTITGAPDCKPWGTGGPFTVTLATGDGDKTVTATVTDNAGNASTAVSDTIGLDTVAPTITSVAINSDTPFTNQVGVSVSIVASDSIGGSDVAEVALREGAGAFGSYVFFASPIAFTVSTGDGSKTVGVRVRDAAGNVSSERTDTITLDTGAPTGSVVINSGNPAYTTGTAVELVLSAADPSGVTGHCTRDTAGTKPAANDPCFVALTSTSYTLPTGDGSKSVHTWFRDAAGNVSATAVTDAITLDTTAPTGTVVINGGAAFTGTTAVTLTLNGTDVNGVTHHCTRDADSPAPTAGDPCFVALSTTAYTLPATDGTLSVYTWFRDTAGNVSATPATDAITLDATAPTGTVVINAGNPAFTNSTAVTLVLTPTDTNAVTHHCTRNGAAGTRPAAADGCWVPLATTAHTLPTPDGAKSVFTWFKDEAGNVSTAAATDDITLDTAAPTGTVVINTGDPAYTTSAAVNLVFTADPDVTLHCTRDTAGTKPAANDPCFVALSTTSYTLPSPDGVKAVHTWFRDAAGNVSASAVTDSVILDTGAPSGTFVLNAGNPAYTTGTAVTLVFSGTGDASAYCPREGSAGAAPAPTDACFRALTTTAYALSTGDGLKTLYAWFRDAAGNVSATASSDDITLDTALPTGTVVINGGAAYTASGTVTLELSASADATHHCTRNDAAGTKPASNDSCFILLATTTHPLSAGDGAKSVHTWYRDAAGNVSAAAATDGIVRDGTPPTGTVTINGGNASTNNAAVTLTLTAGDGTGTGVTAHCTRDVAGSQPAPGDSCFQPLTTTAYNLPSGDGSKSVFTWYRDAAGNVSATAASDAITLDTTAPSGTFTLNAGNPQYTTAAAVAFVFSGTGDATHYCPRQDAAGTAPAPGDSCFVALGTTAYTLSGADGLKTMYAWFRDGAGNVSAVAASDAITLDTAAPTGTLVVNGGDAFTSSGTVTLGLTASADATHYCPRNDAAGARPAAGDGCFVLLATTTHALSAGDGAKTVHAWFRDAAGNVSAAAASDGITRDSGAPTGTVSINGGAAATNSATVTLSFTTNDGSGSGVTHHCSRDTAGTQPASNDSCFQLLATNTYSLSSGDGAKTVYTWFRDAAGNVSTAVTSANITLDTAAPSGTFVINSGNPDFTNSVNATLVFSGTGDATHHCTRTSAGAQPLATDGCFQPLATTALTLPTGDGLKSYFTWFRDAAGNVSAAAVSDGITLDTTAPTGTVTINSGNPPETNTTAVTLVFTVGDGTGSGPTHHCSRDTAGTQPTSSDGCWRLLSDASYTLPTGDGTKTVHSWFKDALGNVTTAAVNDSISLNTAAVTGTVVINTGNPAFTGSQSVTLVFTTTATHHCTANSPGTQPALGAPCWTPIDTTGYTLPAGDGSKTVYSWFRNSVTVSSAAASDTITLDTTAPTSGAVAINAGAGNTNTRSVTLSFSPNDGSGSGVTHHCTRADSQGAAPASGDSCFVPLATTAFTLSVGDGTKSVHTWYRDAVGNVANGAESDTITLDTTAPAGTVSINSGAAYTTSTSVTLSFSPNDGAGTGVTHHCTRTTPGTQPLASDGCFQLLSATSFTLGSGDGTKTLYTWFRDAAGNVSAAATSDDIILDTAAPTGTVVINTGNPAYSNTTAVTLVLSAAGATHHCTKNVATAPTGPADGCFQLMASTAHSLTTGDGSKTVYTWFRDAAGNVSTTAATDTISLDATAPTGTVVINAGDPTHTATTSVTLVLSPSDTGSGVTHHCTRDTAGTKPLANDACFSLLSSTAYTLPTPDGSKSVFTWYLDAAGNVSASATSDTITLDTTAPTGTFTINAGNPDYTTSTSVTLSFSAVADVTHHCTRDTAGTQPAGNDACWKTLATNGYTLASPDGVKTLYAWFKDSAGNVSTTAVSDTITLDTSLPSGTFVINAGANFTNTTAVTLTFTPSSDATMYCPRNGSAGTQPPASDSCFVALANTSHSLLTGDGAKTVYAWFRDAAGNVSSASTNDSITLDTAAPTGTVLIGAGNPTYATSTSVTLTFTTSDGTGAGVTHHCTRNASTPAPSAADSCFVPIATTAYTLPTPDGSKTVYTWFRDGANNVSTTFASDDITLDTTAPSGTVSINGGATYTNSVNVTLTLNAGDATHHCSRNSPGTQPLPGDACFRTIATTAYVMPNGDGSKSVYTWFKDAAGNVSTSAVLDTITLDTIAPLTGPVNLAGGAAWTNSLSVAFNNTSASDESSGLNQVCTGTSNPPGNCVAYTTSPSVTLTPGDGQKTAYLTVIDSAGNVSDAGMDTIGLDMTLPTITSVLVQDGGVYTNNTTVSVQVTGFDADGGSGLLGKYYSVNDGGTFIGYAWLGGSSDSISLPSGDGTKVVVARLRDNALNYSTTLSDSIILDQTPPTGVLTAPVRYTNSATVNLTVSANADLSGVVGMCPRLTFTSTSPTPPSGPSDSCFVAYANSYSVNLTSLGSFSSTSDGDRRIHMYFRDGAGNVSTTPATVDVHYDVTPPSAPTQYSPTPGNHGFTANWAAPSDGSGGSGAISYRVGVSVMSGGSYGFTDVANVTSAWIEAPNGITRYVVVAAVDRAGNVSANSAQQSVLPRWPWNWRYREATSTSIRAAEAFTYSSSTRWIIAGDFGALFTSDNDYASWTRRDALTDSRINTIYRRGPNNMFVGGVGGLIARSGDEGNSFSRDTVDTGAANLEITDIAYAGSTVEGTFFMLTYQHYVAVTATGYVLKNKSVSSLGTHWDLQSTRPTTQRLNSVTRCSSLSGACASGDVVVAVGDNGTIIRSTDNGSTWSPITPPSGYGSPVDFSAVIARPNTNELFIGVLNPTTGNYGLLYSSNGGASFTAVTATGWQNVGVSRMDLSLDDTYVFATSGNTVKRFAVSAPSTVSSASNLTDASLAVAGVSATKVGAFGNYGYTMMSTNYPTTGLGSVSDGNFVGMNDVTVRPGYSTQAWAAGNSGYIRYTIDTGTSWTDVDTGSTTFYGISAVSVQAGAYVVAVGSGGGIYELKPGSTWAADDESGALTTDQLNAVSCRGTTSSNAVTCVAVGINMRVYTFTSSNVTATDSGDWQQSFYTSGGVTYNDVVTYVDSGSVVRSVIVGAGGTYRRQATTWGANGSLPSSVDYFGVTAHKSGNGQVMAVGASGKVAFSTNHGETWTDVSPTGVSSTLVSCSHIYNTNDWYVMTNGGVIYKGTWSGSAFTWTQLVQQIATTMTAIESAPTHTDRAYAVGGVGALLVTTTAGE
jgi:hypothetical protein